MNRRDFLTASAGLLLSLGAWPGRDAYAASRTKNISFAVLNDLHCMSDECCEWLEKVTASVKEHSPSFCVIAGDLTDTAPPKYMDAVRSIFSGLNCPLHVQIGNHDYLSSSDRSSFSDVFPNSLNYFFTTGGWQCLALDTTDGMRFENTNISQDTLRWVDSTLPRLSKSAPLIIFTHFPLGRDVIYRPRNADALLERFLEYNLQAVYSGHYHGFTERKKGASVLTTNVCCALKRNNHDGSSAKGYFLCSTDEGSVSRRFVEITVPKA